MRKNLSLIAFISLLSANEINIGEINVNQAANKNMGGGMKNILAIKNIA